ncbi:hypothetical protein DV453_001342 [Geotrichum candidum]|nr:hypothetical protein DV453_001342 [Geotrichum candidum]
MNSVSDSKRLSASVPPHKVSLKVLRLSRPKLHPPRLLITDPFGPDDDDASSRLPKSSAAIPTHSVDGDDHETNDNTNSNNIEETSGSISIGSKSNKMAPPLLLSLPASFGNLYVGETFRCIFSLSPIQPAAATANAPAPLDVTLAVSVSTPNREHPIPLIQETSHLDGENQFIIEYETRDAGIHVISAVVTYAEPNVAPITFTKIYRFTAEQGLLIRTKISTVSPTACAFEAQIENVTDAALTLEATEFVAPPGWVSSSIATGQENGVAGGGKGTGPLLMPKEVWQFCYLVSHDDGDATGNEPISSATSSSGTSSNRNSVVGTPVPRQSVGMGKLSVAWTREFLGEKGWLMTGHLKRSASMQ